MVEQDLSASAAADRATQATPQAPEEGLGHSVSVPSADFTAEDFLAWARTRRTDEAYDYSSNERCAVCHYLIDRGITFKRVAGDYYRLPDESRKPLPQAIQQPLVVGEWTYGALVERLEGAA